MTPLMMKKEDCCRDLVSHLTDSLSLAFLCLSLYAKGVVPVYLDLSSKLIPVVNRGLAAKCQVKIPRFSLFNAYRLCPACKVYRITKNNSLSQLFTKRFCKLYVQSTVMHGMVLQKNNFRIL